MWNIFRWVIKKIILESVENVNFVEISIYTKKETNCFSENNNITLNETECRSSPVHANKSNQSDNESHKYSSTSSKKLKVSLDSYQNQSVNEDYDNHCNIFVELGILKSMVERVDTCPECSSRLRIKLSPEEHQRFANKLNILCEQCS